VDKLAGFFKRIGTRILEYFKNMKKGQRTRFIVLATLVLVIIVAVSVFLNQKSYTVLYSGMDPKDAGDALAVLEGMKIDAKPQGDDTILVDASQVDTVRMELAAQGYPKSGFNYNFDIFKNASGLGTTDMEKQVYYTFQLQANIRQTIRQLDKVEDASVTINLPEDSPFVLSEDKKPATAAVMLKLKDGETIDNGEVRAIGELVSKSVSGLKLEDVRIIDSKMNLYSLEKDDAAENVNSQMQLQQTVKNNLQQQIINLLNPVFGQDKVKAEVNVTLNFDDQTSESTVFTSPTGNDKGLAVSMKELAEVIKNDGTGNVAGTDANGAASQYLAGNTDPNAVYSQVSRETNMEVNETKTQIKNAKGSVKDLSVSVIIDSSDMAEDYRQNVSNLVATAIGVAPDRITVDMLPFKKMDTNAATDAFDKQKQLMDAAQNASTTRLIIIAGAALVVMLLLFAMVKSMKKSKVEYVPAEGAIGAAFGGIDMVADEEIIPPPEPMEVNFEAKEDTSLTQLEKYIDKSPESVAQLLRNWLSDDYGR
jgi:flagellar M-ring protein FliF